MILFACILVIVFGYMSVVFRRIKRIVDMQQYIIDLVFSGDALNLEWRRKMHYCNRQSYFLEYTLLPINLDRVLSLQEILDLHTVQGSWVNPDMRWISRKTSKSLALPRKITR